MGYALIDESNLTATASAIRSQLGVSNAFTPAQFAPAIASISGGGGGITVDDIAGRKISGSIYGSTASIVRPYAFYACYDLTAASFPSATTLGVYAFGYCYSLTTISFPLVQTISASAFYNCSRIISANFSELVSIGNAVFSNMTSLQSFVAPKVKYIGINAFHACRLLSELSLPVISYIGSSAFQGCYKLLSLYLNSVSAVPSLGTNAFSTTPIGGRTTSTGGVYGSVFVPASLFNSFKTATNWSSISARLVSV